MYKLEDRTIDSYGRIILNDDEIIKLLFSGKQNFNGVYTEQSEEIELYNQSIDYFGLQGQKLSVYSEEDNMSLEEFDKINTNTWILPEEYLELNVEKYVLDKCSTKEELIRAQEELALYKKHEMFIVLKCLIYLVDHMRENNIVWGVGRGSACSSYVLYLLNVHRVNSIKFNLDYMEFFKS